MTFLLWTLSNSGLLILFLDESPFPTSVVTEVVLDVSAQEILSTFNKKGLFNNQQSTINSQQSTINDQQSTINNHASRMYLLRCYARSFALRCSKRNECVVQNETDSFLCCPSISPLRTRLWDIRDGCRVCILPNIPKNRRDIDALGMSALRFDGIASCVAKLSESFVAERRHKLLRDEYNLFLRT